MSRFGLGFVGGKAGIAFVGSSSIVGASSASAAIPKPSGVQAGDVLLYYAENIVNGRTMTTVPSGFSDLATYTGSNTSVVLYWKIAGGSEPSTYTWQWSASGAWSSIMMAYRGAANQTAGSITVASSATATGASISPPTPGALIAFYGIENASATITTPPSGLTQREFFTSASPRGVGYDLLESPAGATGNVNLVWNTSGDTNGVLVQIYE